ncbi:hypothetical protein J6590_008503 [Homalodisca vitripennis]|nr:hypothetical protein J6590_008503 [Homalodisca vitripennis]
MNHYELSVRVGYCGLTWETWQDKIAGQYMNHYELSVRVLRGNHATETRMYRRPKINRLCLGAGRPRPRCRSRARPASGGDYRGLRLIARADPKM